MRWWTGSSSPRRSGPRPPPGLRSTTSAACASASPARCRSSPTPPTASRARSSSSTRGRTTRSAPVWSRPETQPPHRPRPPVLARVDLRGGDRRARAAAVGGARTTFLSTTGEAPRGTKPTPEVDNVPLTPADASRGTKPTSIPCTPHQPPCAGSLHRVRTETARLLLGRQREQAVEGARVAVDVRARVADRAQPLGHGVDAEVAELAVGNLVPGEVTGDARVGHGANGVARGDRVILRVLVVVDEDRVGGALLLPPSRGRHPLGAALDLACERQRGRAHGREVPPWMDADHDVHPARARRAR